VIAFREQANELRPFLFSIEHFTDQQLRERLDEETLGPRVDPHGRIIPVEQADER